ncbi:MAG TPA: IS66 family transposase [Treponemataceae bacterium]|nr:MAG: Transposase IS66 family protein [Spirochaetes bacterium ADurb.Bin215]HPA10639.1 IS66 family transposase [Treponemataceae bacterium]
MNIAALPKDVQDYVQSLEENWKQRCSTIDSSWQERYSELEEQYKLLLIQKFCRKSEKSETEENQQLLFAEEPSSQEEAANEQIETIKTYSRKKPGRKPIPDSLPREEVVIDIPEEDKHCACGHDLVRIGEETAERLQVILPKMWVERIVRPKYACRNCEGSGDEDKHAVRIAPPSVNIIPKSIVSPGLLSFIITNKFVDHLPYYRQEGRFDRLGIQISRQNMSNWQQMAFEKIRPLLDLLKKHIQSGPVINMDETPVQVLGEANRKDTQKSYMWLVRGGPPEHPAFLYSYRETRASKHITELLEGFTGYLQTDGYEAYATALKGNDAIVHVGCMAHARRKFDEAAKVSKKESSANEALKHIRNLYRIESELRSMNLSVDEFVRMRKEKAGPVLEAFKKWLEKRVVQVPPSLGLGKAISYTLNEWPKLIRYLESPYLTPDNYVSENAIRPFVLGRKNWLFSGSPEGAESSCAMYSLIETAKHNGLNPYEYLVKVFEAAPLLEKQEEWEAILPWNIK